ncbi:Resolvase domain [Ruminiclostridium papyrosolvens DSM 2782]|uniref:Resolvase domain n=1 Tax=Ruminiclostridium papyrosolvens DSM 2782 TaxID=588581 RepID=F1TIJ9_9FIRM|nr:recombinase family protein [Ruminiclostridium papyrosolvens]EGD45816.1 Resolvase domain [Ruminiclostridium papyrosolvens DSM 2782]WES33864.1 recombinase family protein [Ruminiclostridium papyrosolvens DSM 2782]
MPGVRRTVSVIPADPSYNIHNRAEEIRLRVAAYCRVSTELEEQQSSYQAQVDHYTRAIQTNPKWIFAGIYADEGISGTNTKKRVEFNRMIEDCMAGRIDMIITKSISRFARNTLDCISYIRQLRERNIAVYFEKENINTLDGAGELLITILGSLAQEESRSLSTNTRWGVVHRFQQGKIYVNHNKFLGYTKNENGDLVIVPEEAVLVKRIFRLYLEGESIINIKKKLEEEGITTVTGREKWSTSVIDKMLSNEKYMGDALLQKTYTVDYLTKKRVKNNGIVPQYYVEDSHEAIIPKPLYYRVQEEKSRRAELHKGKKGKAKYSSQFALTEILTCAECGSHYRRTTWAKNGKKQIVWRCINRLEHGTKVCQYSPTLKEKSVEVTVMEVINSVINGHRKFTDTLKGNILTAINEKTELPLQKSIDERLYTLQEQLLQYVELNAKADSGSNAYDTKFEQISKKISVLQKKKKEFIEKEKLRANYEQRVDDISQFLDSSNGITQFDNELVRRLIQSINVVSKEKVIVQFKSGKVVESSLL